MSDTKKFSQEEYDKANTTQFKMKLNTKTDADIIEYLDSLNNKQGKVKELIREEIARNKDNKRDTIEYIRKMEDAGHRLTPMGRNLKNELEEYDTIITDTPDALMERLSESYRQAEKEYLQKETQRILDVSKKHRESMKDKRTKGN